MIAKTDCAAPRFTTLNDWLAWQETLHPQTIELGLKRVRTVLQRLHLESPPYLVITVGGTNGKGSCVAMLAAILQAAGYAVGAYTSPHLLRYNERIRINGTEVSDTALCQTFARIDAAREATSLTYFEFSTLAALDLFREARVDVALLEVGLGGRLDAVNSIDADAALVVSIGIDHTDWLGPDRDSIGYEKAGIYRPGRPAIYADPDPPAGLLNQAHALGANLQRVGRDYHFAPTGQRWRWQHGHIQLADLPLPRLPGAHQLGNAAAVLTTLHCLSERLPVSRAAIDIGLTTAWLPGRLQIVPGAVEWILDVAHNPHAAQRLAAHLRERPCTGQTYGIMGVLADKDVKGVITALADEVDFWYPITLAGSRGQTAAELAVLLQATGAPVISSADPLAACRLIQTAAQPGDRIVVFGSFHTVAPILAAQPWHSHQTLSPLGEV